MKTVSWFVKLTVIALFPEFTAHQHRKQKKKKKLFSQAWIWRFILWKSDIQGRARGPGPLSTSSWPQGRVSSGPTTSEAVHWTLLLINSSGEKPAGGRGGVCGEQPSPPGLLSTPPSLDQAYDWAPSVPSLAWAPVSKKSLCLPGSWGTARAVLDKSQEHRAAPGTSLLHGFWAGRPEMSWQALFLSWGTGTHTRKPPSELAPFLAVWTERPRREKEKVEFHPTFRAGMWLVGSGDGQAWRTRWGRGQAGVTG